MSNDFPEDFVFGSATAAFQIEGGGREGGRGPSIWDAFCEEPGRIANDANALVAVDHYHRWEEDLDLMQRMGLNAYRFSVSWSRVLPAGRGRVNAPGVDFYDRLIDGMLARGIEPWLTLYHWDLPLALQQEYGGWLDRRIVEDFAGYAGVIAERFSDRVKHFFTINEFFCFIEKGYAMGRDFDAFAPGLRVSRAELNQASHHALLAHGAAVQALRAAAKGPIQVGLADNPLVPCPVIETTENIDAARKAFRLLNARYLTAIMEGGYPAEYLEAEGADAPTVAEGDFATISQPLDLVAVNMYAPTLVRASENAPGYEVVPFSNTHPTMHMPWLKLGSGIAYWAPRFAKELWNVNAFYISENGCAADDCLNEHGEVLDTDRVEYLRQHFSAAARAVREGMPLRGYFVWSLLDNFEWAYGFSRRFGLHYVNYSTLERTPKLSAQWYRRLIAHRSLV